MKRVLGVVGLCVAALVLYLVAWPVPIDPVAWTPPPAPPLEGPFAVNSALAAAERLPVPGHGPEAMDVGPDGRLYTGVDDGRIIRMGMDGAAPEVFADTGGRPLGLAFDAAGNLIVADSYKGLLSIDAEGRITVLTTEAEGVPFGFADDLGIAGDGTIYFTDASAKFGQTEYILDLLEHRPHGRLLAYVPSSGETRVVLRDLYFANGVAVAPDDAFVLVNETYMYRTRRVWLRGERAGEVDLFLDNLPGLPDNIRCNGVDTFWVAFATPRVAQVDTLLAPRPFLRKLLLRLPEAVWPAAIPHAFVIGVDLDGNLTHNLQDAGPDAFASITCANEFDGMLYLGSIEHTALARVPLPATGGPEHDGNA